MPYIKPESRVELEVITDLIDGLTIGTAGDLNYLVTYLCKSFLREDDLSYASMNEVIGALECAKLEMYRRVLSPYEDKKIEENGDVKVP